ncbi:MAG: nicotinamide-nucleotide amidohydrolase family protein, partial [Candidatus Cloacimonetes bacterium]|nr:nicotinamide-nucleotide amidohydrolase family protein [Candidatus Cloacimonadota bacterium]
NDTKESLLCVPKNILETFGAVSKETTSYMLQGGYELFNTDIVAAVTGVAGPSGGTTEKPVGTVYIGVKFRDMICIEKCFYTGDRNQIRHKAAEKILVKLIDLVK